MTEARDDISDLFRQAEACGLREQSEVLLKEYSAAMQRIVDWHHEAVLRGPHTGDELFDLLVLPPEGDQLAVEIDCATMPEKKVRGRWEKVKDWPGKMLVVVSARPGKVLDRIKALVEWGDDVNDFAYYADLADLVRRPAGRVWIDCEGCRFTLEELAKKGE